MLFPPASVSISMENGPLWKGEFISLMPRGAEIKACLGTRKSELLQGLWGICHLLSTGSRETCDLWVKVLGGSLDFSLYSPPQVLDHPVGPCFPARQSSPLRIWWKNHLPQQVQAEEIGAMTSPLMKLAGPVTLMVRPGICYIFLCYHLFHENLNYSLKHVDEGCLTISTAAAKC